MSDNPDTIDTILDDMLNEGHTGPADALEWVQAKMEYYAGRIKAAWKRQSVTGSHGLGNAAAMHEALKRIVAASIVAKNANAPEWILQRMADIFAMATTALAATDGGSK